MIVGCSGFPVAQERYWRELAAVEVETTLFRLPRAATVEAWRSRAPASAVFLMKAWQIITHPADHSSYKHLGRSLRPSERSHVGHFRATEEVAEAFGQTLRTAQALKAKAILFQTPSTFYPSSDCLSNLYAFFKKAPRVGISYAWEPRGAGWTDAVLERAAKDLRLTIAGDPLLRTPVEGGSWRYIRAQGAWKGPRPDAEHPYTEAEFEKLERWAQGPGYLVFANRSRWEDARRYLRRAEKRRRP